MLRTLKNDYIIFLDFDGVLNHAGCPSETDFLPDAIWTLNQLHEQYQAKIVLSTSWKEAYVFADLVQLLHDKGILCPVIDKTPIYTGELTSPNITYINELDFNSQIKPTAGRNAEIMSYIRLHNIKHFVVLDDCEMTHPLLRKHQVLTCFYDDTNGGLRKDMLPTIQQIFDNFDN